MDIDFEDLGDDTASALGDAVDEIEVPKVDEELSDIAESDTALSMGLDGDLKDSFEVATSKSPTDDTATVTDSTLGLGEEYEVPVREDLADRLLKRVYRELKEAPESVPEDIILGVPQYALLEPWAQQTHNQSIESVLPVAEVRVVPGPMVHAGHQKQQLFGEYLERKMGDDDADE